MGRVQKKVYSEEKPRLHKTMSPEARENMMISLAMDNAEELLRSGKAPSQIICHFLKLGSQKEQAETEKLKEDTKLSRAKVDALEATKREGELYNEAIKAFKSYNGVEEEDDEEDE